MQTKNIMIVGVGGQGTLLASKLLGRLLLEKGYDVKVSEVHGMSAAAVLLHMSATATRFIHRLLTRARLI